MKKKDNKYESNFKYNKADIYFIYSFLVNFDSFKKIVENNKFKSWNIGLPPERYGLAPTLRIYKCFEREGEKIYGNEIYDTLFENDKKCKLSINNTEIKVKINAITRILDNGAGIFSFKVSFDEEEEPTYKKIHYVLSLSEQAKEKKGLSLINSEGNRTVFSYFIKKIKKISGDLEDQKLGIILDLHRNLSIRDYISKKDYQNPYVVTTAEIDEEDFKETFTSSENIEDDEKLRTKRYLRSKELASILFRVIGNEEENHWKNINYSFIRKFAEYDEKTELLSNMAMDERIFINFHKRSSLAVTSDLSKIPAEFVVPSLLNIVELIRSRWHASIIINTLIDDTLQKLYENPKIANIDFLKDIFNLRRLFSFFLQDPITYSFEGGAITEIVDIAYKKLWFDRLMDLTLQKFSTIDKVYEDLTDYIRFSEFSSLKNE